MKKKILTPCSISRRLAELMRLRIDLFVAEKNLLLLSSLGPMVLYREVDS